MVTIGNEREIAYMSVVIDNHEYQIPEAVVKTLRALKADLEAEEKAHQKTIADYEKRYSKTDNTTALRIMANLAEGVPHINTSRHGLSEKFSRDESCLVHSLDQFDVVRGETVFSFRDEVYKRITQAMRGYKNNGSRYD